MNRSRNRLEGQTAVVTGAARGIGLATARRLAAEGLAVAMADADGPELERAGGTIPDALIIEADVANLQSMERMFSATEAEFGPIDVLINNAALMSLGPLTELSEKAARKQL